MGTDHPDRQVTFTVHIEDPAQTESVARALRTVGLTIEDRDISSLAGIVTGVGPKALEQVISRLPGVGHVREAWSFQLAPFKDDIPQ